jgi:hypothetical protein
VPAVLAAATGSDWNAGGSIMTFYFPVGLFVVVAAILYLLLFSRPHKRVPAHRGLAAARAGGAGDVPATAAAPGADAPRDGRVGDADSRPEDGATREGTVDGE